MEQLIEQLNSMTPLAIIALLGIIIFMLVKNKQGQVAITKNHLHCLPDMSDSLKRIEEKLDRINDNIISMKSGIEQVESWNIPKWLKK